MKVKNIDLDRVYAYQESKYDEPQPVRVVHAGAMFYDGRRSRSMLRPDPDRLVFGKSEGMTANESTGLIAVSTVKFRASHAERQAAREVDPQRVLAPVTAREVLALRFADANSPIRPGVYPRIVNPRYLIGEYDAVMQARADAQEARRTAEAAKVQREIDNASRYHAITDRLADLGVIGRVDPSRRFARREHSKITLSADQIEALIAMIPDASDDEAPDESAWEYAEGQR